MKRGSMLGVLFGCGAVLLLVLPFGVRAQRAGALETLRSLELQKLDEALSLVRQSQRCVAAAASLRALRDCHRRERESEWRLRERFQERIEAARERLGVEGPPGPGGGGWRPGPPPGPGGGFPGPPPGRRLPPPGW